MIQDIVVYIIIGIALIGFGRFCYRKLNAFRKKNGCAGCTACSRSHKSPGCNCGSSRK